MDRPLQTDRVNAERLKQATKIAFGFCIIIALFLFARSMITTSINLSELRTATVVMGNLEAGLSAGGTVIPKLEEVISSEISAQVLEVFARPGQAVNKGDLILRLDTKSVKVLLDSLEERIAMKDNQILSKELNTRKTLNNTNSRIELLQVDLESRKTKFQRLTLLASSGATAKHDLLEAELDVKRTIIEIRQLKTSLNDLQDSNDAEITGIKLERSILDKEQKEKFRLLDSAMVRAPRAGVLTWLQEEEGTSIVPGQPIARVADLTRFRVEATISDFYAAQLFEGQEVKVRHADKQLLGRVQTVLPTINNGILTLIVELDNPSAKNLRSNLRVEVELLTGKIQNTLMVKQGPFINGSGIQQIFVIEGDRAIRKKVEIGIGNSEYYQIINGLSKDDVVIISSMSDYLHLEKININ